MDHIISIGYNRSASSTGETEAMNYIKKQLQDNNLDSKVDYFEWSGPLEILLRISYVIIISYLLIYRLFLIVVAYFIIKYMFASTRNLTLFKKEESKNVFTTISPGEYTLNRPLVIISAHYDSLSTNLPYRLQLIIFFIYRLIVIFYVLVAITFATLFTLEYLQILSISNFMVIFITSSSVGGVMVSIPIVYLVFVEKPSPGSIDNASGVAIAIELAKLLKKNPLKNMDVIILWTGAEEWGLKGSKHFCKKYFRNFKQKYDLNNSFNINIDMVGTYIGLLDKTGLIIKRKMNKDLNEKLDTVAKQLNVPIVRYNRNIKPKSDYKIFKKYARRLRRKLQVSCFHSSKDSKYIHSARDTPDNCSIENLNGCLKICYHTLKNIDSSL
ncbi:MAG: M20/M25/M40 family metallo-hydrolase [Promethearchaeota archaeon]|nr:MAG: M20/M25/M40 family metallo-hydrolase [Candidatus Lokiarchaeota archaeon]